MLQESNDPNAEHCSFCHKIIPEGSMVCPVCKRALIHSRPSVLSFEQTMIASYLTCEQNQLRSFEKDNE